MQKVKATRDDSGHWYIIPNELYDEFCLDEQNEEMIYVLLMMFILTTITFLLSWLTDPVLLKYNSIIKKR